MPETHNLLGLSASPQALCPGGPTVLCKGENGVGEIPNRNLKIAMSRNNAKSGFKIKIRSGVSGGAVLALFVLMGTFPARSQPQQLTGTNFATVMQDNTLSATNKGGVKFKAYFLPGGVATYKDEHGAEDNGTWRIKDGDQVCIVWNKIAGGEEHCAKVYVEGKDLIWKGDASSGEGKLMGSVQ